jgi:hypothetical protein
MLSFWWLRESHYTAGDKLRIHVTVTPGDLKYQRFWEAQIASEADTAIALTHPAGRRSIRPLREN